MLKTRLVVVNSSALIFEVCSESEIYKLNTWLYLVCMKYMYGVHEVVFSVYEV